MWVNYIIPVLVWLGDDRSGGDLYELNSDRRRDPSIEQPPLDASPPPIRNADVANLALALLGLPPVHGSPIDAAPHSEPAISGLPANDR